MLLESVHEFPGLARCAELFALFRLVYVYHWGIKLIHILPLLIRMLHHIDLIILKRSLVPDVGKDFLRIRT